jgi:hypothetical protein
MEPANTDSELVLRSANRELSRLLGKPEPPLAAGAAQAMNDALWVWGVLGGKEVGKSTLINALAGAEVVDRGRPVGEGTFQPAAYLHAADADAFRSRFASLDGVPISVHDAAPQSMRGLVLIDLPDFDSTFADHVAQVRRVANLLDGVIWVTTPKKVGDLRAMHEIQGVLKDRVNFVYVVNKIDWLLAQSDAAPRDDLERLRTATRQQIKACDPNGASDALFTITARHRTQEEVLDFIARSRDFDDVRALGDRLEPLQKAVRKVLEQFDALRRTLTTPPTAEAAAANKRANLGYQTRVQASQLLEHYKPHYLLDRVKRAAAEGRVKEIVDRSLSTHYCLHVVRMLNGERRLFGEWSGTLFRQRVARWPLLGLIAWPITLLGALFGEMRALWRSSRSHEADDPFRLEGLSLGERFQAIIDGVRALLAGVTRDLRIELPAAGALEIDFRRHTATFAQQIREAAITPYLNKRPTIVGRAFRWVFPVAVLLWFPFVQPILEGGLEFIARGEIWNAQMLRVLVSALSAANALQGLCVSVIILAGVTAAVYSVATRDTLVALERLRSAPPADVGRPLTEIVVHTIRRPVQEQQERLEELVATLTSLTSNCTSAGKPQKPSVSDLEQTRSWRRGS